MIISDSAGPLAYAIDASESTLSLCTKVEKVEPNRQDKQELVKTCRLFPTSLLTVMGHVINQCAKANLKRKRAGTVSCCVSGAALNWAAYLSEKFSSC
jgi:hypothetical protein